ncbi:GDSL esterase/lipase At4g10955 [Elaeis guineensis]|uniref:GDSL esterase/lipase At4g10955 n=1 Tax=Elaeis guineensis var. tenera TaxID=51953 RepID=A0A6I9R1V3_ELAGV|nr:GDSL esterase/lipase At4g10955 [Elaeis guineensis]
MAAKKSQKKNMFDFSGPTHLTSVNWASPNHRRTVAACLVQGAYALEYDRQNHQNCAPAWWKKFDFELKKKLIDRADSSIFGAIYEFKPRKYIQNSSSSAPKIVIAFRGTLFKKETFWQDIKLDLDQFMNDLSRAPRCEVAVRAVEEMTSSGAGRNLWLAGHSLGSAIAMHAGKNMAKRGINLEAFLFNPPYPSGTVEWIPNEKLKRGIQIASSVVAATVAFAKKGCVENSREHFAQISSWIPHLFVNSDDHFCSGYIGYFEHRENMKKMGAGIIGNLATRNSVRAIALGTQTEPLHLLPSANLLVNSVDRNLTACPLKRMRHAHGIYQWWSQHLSLKSKECRYRPSFS